LIDLDNIKSVSVYGPRSFESAEKFAAVLPQKLEEILLKENLPSGERRKEISKKLDINIEAAQDLSPAARQADIIVTATPSTEPIVKKGDVRPGTHFSCVGSDISGKEEIDPQIFAGARVVVDDIAQALAVGETEIPVKTGVIFEKDIVGEIGEIISGKKEVRRSESDVTIFDSTGIALQDLAVSKLALDKDRELKIGQTINL
jgi:ornithine cyclodeaminase/alanine dehydrogenase